MAEFQTGAQKSNKTVFIELWSELGGYIKFEFQQASVSLREKFDDMAE